jgi:hypothetical protein
MLDLMRRKVTPNLTESMGEGPIIIIIFRSGRECE